MYPFVLTVHNIVRWLVLIFGIIAIVKAFIGWSGKKEWRSLDNQLGLAFTISLDVQVLLGFLLYVVLSPITTNAFSSFGSAMSDSATRFFLVEHLLMMIIALVLAHIGRSRAKKADTDVSKHKNAAIFFTIAVLLIIIGIPWYRPLLPF
jgi:hypothetical protein